MHKIIYAGEEYLTGDAIAEALLSYSRALGDDERAAIIEIPIREEDGTVAQAKFLIGPASQIVTIAAVDASDELEDAELVRRLQELTRGVESPTAGHVEVATDEEIPDLG